MGDRSAAAAVALRAARERLAQLATSSAEEEETGMAAPEHWDPVVEVALLYSPPYWPAEAQRPSFKRGGPRGFFEVLRFPERLCAALMEGGGHYALNVSGGGRTFAHMCAPFVLLHARRLAAAIFGE